MTATVTEIKGNTPEQPPAVKVEAVRITVTGYRGDKTTVQNLDFNRPAGTSDEQTIAVAWRQIQPAGGILVDNGKNSMSIYPFGSFDKVDIEVSPVIGVSL